MERMKSPNGVHYSGRPRMCVCSSCDLRKDVCKYCKLFTGMLVLLYNNIEKEGTKLTVPGIYMNNNILNT